MAFSLDDYKGEATDPNADSTAISNEFLGAPKESRTGGVIDIVKQDVNTVLSPFGTLGAHIENHIFGSKQLTAKEAKEKYPNVSYPNGGSENVIREASTEKSNHDFNSALINNMPDGILTSAAKFVPTAIGLSLQGAAVTALAPEATTAAAVAEGASIWGKVAQGAASGAVDFSSQLLPFQFAQQAQQSKIQEPIGVGDEISQLASNAVLGSVMGGAGSFIKGKYLDNFNEKFEQAKKEEFKNDVETAIGPKKVMTAESHSEMIKTSAAQIKEGKNVNIDPIIKQGKYAERVSDPIPSDEEIESLSKDAVDSSKAELERLSKELSKESDNHLDLVKKIKESGKSTVLSIKEMMQVTSNPDTRFLLKERYGDTLANQIDRRIDLRPIDKKRMESIDKNSILKDREMLQEELDRKRKNLEAYKEKDSEGFNRKEHIEKQSNKIKDIEDHLENIKDGKRLHPHNNDLKKILDIKKKIAGIRNGIDYHQGIIDSKEVLGLARDTSIPLTKEELQSAAEHQQSYLSDEGITDDVKAMLLDEPELEDDEEVSLDSIDMDSLDEKETNIIDDIKEELERSNKLRSVLKKFMGCLNE